MMYLLGLSTDYQPDGRVITQVLTPSVDASFTELGDVYKQLNAPYGAFANSLIVASTNGIKADDGFYLKMEQKIQLMTARRDMLVQPAIPSRSVASAARSSSSSIGCSASSPAADATTQTLGATSPTRQSRPFLPGLSAPVVTCYRITVANGTWPPTNAPPDFQQTCARRFGVRPSSRSAVLPADTQRLVSHRTG
jgi:hypothetical protein